jgi:hypothetical protein
MKYGGGRLADLWYALFYWCCYFKRRLPPLRLPPLARKPLSAIRTRTAKQAIMGSFGMHPT